jgi:hypothetical protein
MIPGPKDDSMKMCRGVEVTYFSSLYMEEGPFFSQIAI